MVMVALTPKRQQNYRPTFLRFTELETYVSPSVVKMLVGNKLDKVTPLSCELSFQDTYSEPTGI